MMVTSALQRLLDQFEGHPALRQLRDGAVKNFATGRLDALLELYQNAIPLLEQVIWNSNPGLGQFASYQALFREMEALIALRGNDDRHDFIVVIPVADRPQQLRRCLDSLLDLCKSYHYGGCVNGRFSKVSVLIADDSKEEENRASNREMAKALNAQGIEAHYFDLEQQWELQEALDGEQRERLSRVVGNQGRAQFYHKGPSIMRNISYLKLNELAAKKANPLFWFVDSDQEFKIELESEAGEIDPAALNYFYQLDRVFTHSLTEVLTGKVVGDPPVSPAVMVGNFLADVISFLQSMAAFEHQEACQFHGPKGRSDSDAAYHDMANLFGFVPARAPYQYECPLQGAHDNSACLATFAAGLNCFFSGEHPTRKTRFAYQDVLGSLQPARTIYTGNYVVKPAALSYFVPFATLRLRMAGPVLGRIMKSELQERFVSANLPMLHRRTVQETGQSEFRPGVEHSRDAIDLAGEFERQFFGDVMLFSIEKLVELGYPGRAVPRDLVEQSVSTTEREMYQRYAQKHGEIVEKLKLLGALLGDRATWWNRLPGLAAATRDMASFAANMERNFGAVAKGYELIGPGANKQGRMGGIVEAIMEYPDDRRAWERTLSKS